MNKNRFKSFGKTARFACGVVGNWLLTLERFSLPLNALGAVTMLLLIFKFIVGLYIACFNGSRFVAVTFFSAECRDMRCFYVL